MPAVSGGLSAAVPTVGSLPPGLWGLTSLGTQTARPMPSPGGSCSGLRPLPWAPQAGIPLLRLLLLQGAAGGVTWEAAVWGWRQGKETRSQIKATTPHRQLIGCGDWFREHLRPVGGLAPHLRAQHQLPRPVLVGVGTPRSSPSPAVGGQARMQPEQQELGQASWGPFQMPAGGRQPPRHGAIRPPRAPAQLIHGCAAPGISGRWREY